MKCKYEGEGRYEGRCMGTKEIDPCPGYDKCSHFKPNFKTNGDNIRSMTDEELARFLAKFYLHCCNCPADKVCKGCHPTPLIDCEDWFEEWLKLPQKEREE